MPKTKPPYAPEFRQQIVDLVHAGRSMTELSREFDVSTHSISTWVAREAAGERGTSSSLNDVEREELKKLRRQVKQLQQERDILAKGLRPGSREKARRHPAGLRTRECEPGGLQDQDDVSSAGCRPSSVPVVVTLPTNGCKTVHGVRWRCLRQRYGGKLLRFAGMRTHRTAQLAIEDRGEDGIVHVH